MLNEKPGLVKVANDTLHRAREESEHSEKILIGHNTGLRVGRYTTMGPTNHNSRNVRIGKYDGLHLYSLLGVLNVAGREPRGEVLPTRQPGTVSHWKTVRQRRGYLGNHSRGTSNPRSSVFIIPTSNMWGNLQY